MLEKHIEQKVMKYAKDKNFLTYKFTSPSNRSVPDRIIISPRGQLLFIEFKQKGKLPTKLQQITFDKLAERGLKIIVVDEYNKGKELIDAYI